jgi:hypothetical protein
MSFNDLPQTPRPVVFDRWVNEGPAQGGAVDAGDQQDGRGNDDVQPADVLADITPDFDETL